MAEGAGSSMKERGCSPQDLISVGTSRPPSFPLPVFPLPSSLLCLMLLDQAWARDLSGVEDEIWGRWWGWIWCLVGYGYRTSHSTIRAAQCLILYLHVHSLMDRKSLQVEPILITVLVPGWCASPLTLANAAPLLLFVEGWGVKGRFHPPLSSYPDLFSFTWDPPHT